MLHIWFTINDSSSSQNGAKHLFMMIKLTRMFILSSNVMPFMLIQKNLLFYIINDESRINRQIGQRRVKKAREQNKGNTFRSLKVPDHKFEATSYTEMINWQTVNITKPPLTHGISDEEINCSINSKEKKNFLYLLS